MRLVRPADQPIAWVGSDRLLLSDVTIYGLHRKVVACKDDIPNMVAWLEAAYREAGTARIHYWLVPKENGFCYLWIIWKEG